MEKQAEGFIRPIGVGKQLLLSIGVHVEGKYLLKSFSFSLKSPSNLFLMRKEGVNGIFFIFIKGF